MQMKGFVRFILKQLSFLFQHFTGILLQKKPLETASFAIYIM